ncbi:predicted protein [Streptomyces albidoflavus]|nr:predicted protein [Streptomyces albidoflavus]
MRGELRLEVGGAGAQRRLHLHAGLDERPQLLGQPFEVGPLAEQHEDRLDRVGAVVRGVAGGGEDQGGAEREDVAGAGDAAGVLGLLGRHVGGGADGDVGHGQPGVGDAGGDAEVDDARAVLDDQDVGRLEVAVDEPGAVDRLEGLGDAGGEPAHGGRGQRPALVHYFLQRGRRHVGGGEPGDGGAGVGVDDGGGVEAGDGTRGLDLAGEADPEQLVLGQLGADRLDRHPASRGRPGQIHQAHTAGPEPRQHLERSDPSRIVLRQLLHHYLPTSPYGPPFRTVPCSVSPTAPPPAVRPPIVAGRAVRGEPGAEPGCLVMIPYEPVMPTAPGPHRIPPCPLPGDATSVGKGVAPSRHPSPAPATSSTACGRRTPAAGTRRTAPRTTRSAQRTASPRCPRGPGKVTRRHRRKARAIPRTTVRTPPPHPCRISVRAQYEGHIWEPFAGPFTPSRRPFSLARPHLQSIESRSVRPSVS